MDDQSANAPISQLIGDVGAKLVALIRAEVRILTAEMQGKLAANASGAAWLAMSVATMLFAFIFMLLAAFFLLRRGNVDADVAALIIAFALVCLSGLFAVKGRSILRGFDLLPERSLKSLSRDAGLFKRNPVGG